MQKLQKGQQDHSGSGHTGRRMPASTPAPFDAKDWWQHVVGTLMGEHLHSSLPIVQASPETSCGSDISDSHPNLCVSTILGIQSHVMPWKQYCAGQWERFAYQVTLWEPGPIFKAQDSSIGLWALHGHSKKMLSGVGQWFKGKVSSSNCSFTPPQL